MRFEPLALRSFDDGAILVETPKHPFMPPSFVPERSTSVKAAAEEPPPPPVFSEADLKQAEQEGFRKGFLEGEKEGKAQAESEQMQVDRALTGTVEELAGKLHEVVAGYQAFVAEQKAALPHLALTIAKKVAGDALAENPLALVESLVIPAVERMLGEAEIVVTVHPRLADALEKRLATQFAHSGDEGEINIETDPAMAESDCRIAWASGSADRNTQQMWSQVEQLVEDMSASACPTQVEEPKSVDSAEPPSTLDLNENNDSNDTEGA